MKGFFSPDNKDQIFRGIALPTAIKLIRGYGGLGDLGILFFSSDNKYQSDPAQLSY